MKVKGFIMAIVVGVGLSMGFIVKNDTLSVILLLVGGLTLGKMAAIIDS